MSLTKILTEKDVAAEDKLEKVAELVAGARKNYGNEEAEIKAPFVNTAHGSMPFIHLEAASKVEMLRSELGFIKAAAVEAEQQNPGININKKIEELIATNPLLANVDSGVKFDYL